MNRSNPSAAESTSEVSAALVPRSAELAADIYHLIVQEIPALHRDGRVLALLEASVAENVSTMLHVLQHGIDLQNVRAPAAAIGEPALGVTGFRRTHQQAVGGGPAPRRSPPLPRSRRWP